MVRTDVRRDPSLGFASIGAWCAAVRSASRREGASMLPDAVRAALTNYGETSVGASGGFALPPGFAESIETRLKETSLSGLCDNRVASSHEFSIAADSSAPWGTSGVVAEWLAESTAASQRKPALTLLRLPMQKLIILLPTSSELFDDAPGLDAYVQKRFSDALGWSLDESILTGSGVGECWGVKSAKCTLSVTRAVGGDVGRVDLLKMRSQLHVANPANVRWVCHPSVFEKLFAGVPECLPDGRILGFGVVQSQAMSVLGTAFDVAVCDFSEYLLASKRVRLAQSVHWYFDQDMVTLRGTLAVNGQPWWSTSAANLNGSGSTSPFVLLT